VHDRSCIFIIRTGADPESLASTVR